jgi:hypothetical protein
MIHPPNDGMGAKDNDLPVAAVSSTGCKVTIFLETSVPRASIQEIKR